MTETKIYCDHCKRELDGMKDYVGIEIEMNHKWKTMDLCKKCFNEMWDIIDGYCLPYKE